MDAIDSLNVESVVWLKEIEYEIKYHPSTWSVMLAPANVHVDCWHTKPMHIVVVFRSKMWANHRWHRCDDDGVAFGIDYPDCVPKVKRRRWLDDELQQVSID